ncbi:MAG: hypothetical protein OHK0046_19250 [Anaerolineae bacterium]
MSDETQKPENMSDRDLQEIADSVPAPDEYPEGQDEELAASLPEDATVAEVAAVEALEKTEEMTDSPIARAWDAGINAIERSIEETGAISDHAYEEALGVHDAHGDTTVFMGREYPLPIYTSVFLALGALTVIEVLLAEIISSDIKIPFLMGIAVAKALLVVLFYMHLNKDSRIFALVLGLPLGLGLLATLYLLGVPPTGY